MSFEEVWGFNPIEVAPGESGRLGKPISAADFSYSASEEEAARIPSDACAQVAELTRMIWLEHLR